MSFVEVFAIEQIHSVLRPTISQQLDRAIDSQDWELASQSLSAFIDTWPIGGSIQQAWLRWNADCDPVALTILSRANEIISLVGGSSLRIPKPRSLPSYLEIEGNTLIEQRSNICAKALNGDIHGVSFLSPVPLLPAAQLALGELRMEAKGQQALERFGLVGLLAPNAPLWKDCFGRAPAGRVGENLRMMCDLAILPSTPNRLAKGQIEATAWLLWHGPTHPIPTHRIVYELLRNISQGREVAIGEAGLSKEQGDEIIRELIALGALDVST